MSKQILFISHNATRTGAPILLLHFLRWFKENTEIPFRILLGKGGELESDFTELAPTLIFEQQAPLKNTILHRIKRRFFPQQPYSHLYQWLLGQNIGLIYSNTIVNGHILEVLNYLNCPVVSHAHELEYIIHYLGIKYFQKTQELTDHFIACSGSVKNNLVEKHHISSADITVIYEFIPIGSLFLDSLNRKLLEKELDFQEETFVVGASGTTDWRKSTDLFIQLAHLVKNKAKDALIKFVWLGVDYQSTDYFAFQQDILKTGLEYDIYLLNAKLNPLDYFSRFDIFVLTSREDPYPLVCLENALLGKPIICFDKAGGEPEFVEDDCGFVVPYLNLNIMADRIIQLYQSPDLRKKLGENARQKVCNRHDINTAAPKILEVINKYIN
jgi:glycosyltransferase involved in cell wall biosynthesis